MSKFALQLERVHLARSRRPILTGIDLCVGCGEVLFIVGASGSGKTTILRVAAGLEAPDEGRVVIDGRVVSSDGAVRVPPFQRGVSLVFQDGALWDHMTVERHLRFGLEGRGIPPAERDRRVEESLALVGLASRRGERPGHLSGGERQRLALARALAHRPSILLLDEPLAHVDLTSQREVAGKLGDWIRREGPAVLWVTHRPQEVAFVGGSVSVVADGRVVGNVPTAEVPGWLARTGA